MQNISTQQTNIDNCETDADVYRLRRLQRMNLLRQRKLGHHQWHNFKLSRNLRRKAQYNSRQHRNTEQHKIARAHMNPSMRYIVILKDALWHKQSRSLLTYEQLQHFRKVDSDRHHAARAHLTDEHRKQILSQDAFRHKLMYFSRYPIHKEYREQIIQRVLQHHMSKCKSGVCNAECHYREIYDYVGSEKERTKIRDARPKSRFSWNYTNIAKNMPIYFRKK